MRQGAVLWLLLYLTALSSSAQTFTSLVSLDVPNGIEPYAPLVQGIDGNLYGTTFAGNPQTINGYGTVFRMTPDGALTTIYSFCAQTGCADGASPWGGLVQATDGYLYGTTGYDGSGSDPSGTVFKISLTGALSSLFSFDGTDGAGPRGTLIQAGGNFYGTTPDGGTHQLMGTVFKITAAGDLTTLVNFDGTNGDGPWEGLVQAYDGNFYGTTEYGGNFYGTTEYGGPSRSGTIFQMTPTGTLSTVYDFASGDGIHPNSLMQASDGNFYGTTATTVFKITPGGAFTTLHHFGDSENADPIGVIEGTDRNLYGTTNGGGANDLGSIFQITPAGTFTTLYSFSGPDGYQPNAILVQDTNGTFYGTTTWGGTGGLGTVFSLSMGLGPFVKTLTQSGAVGSTVQILGTDLTGASSVAFNGTPAEITFVSPSLITAVVPAGATSGPVTVVTDGVTLLGNRFIIR
jgi:uncharacterized repeat protein (TIGR03803 family)